MVAMVRGKAMGCQWQVQWHGNACDGDDEVDDCNAVGYVSRDSNCDGDRGNDNDDDN
jgi:hypothetical protein